MITQQQQQDRLNYIGASYVPALMDWANRGNPAWQAMFQDGRCDPFTSIRQVWREIVLKEKKEQTQYMLEGQYVERAALDWAEYALGIDALRPRCEVDRHVMRTCGVLCANFDAISNIGCDNPFVIEAKWKRARNRSEPEDPRLVYGPAAVTDLSRINDRVPPRVNFQVQAQLLCAGPEYKIGYVVALRGDNGFGMWKVDRSDSLCSQIEKHAEAFWKQHIEPKIEPEMPVSEAA